ncbi:MAG: T9SS type A sorting domain-containing protein [Bacteroidetes bacterium]|nr:T9SS type A sorting domain-containing protein [Bacteroidota bacterium]
MRKVLLVCFLFSASVMNAQMNLVPNGDFETLSSCPNNQGELNFATPWFQPGGSSPDLYNTCALVNSMAIPQNWTGFQMPHSGNGYAGFAAFAYNYGDNVREYIEVKLSDTLVQGKNYCIEFYISFADSSFWAVNRVGALLSTQQITQTLNDTITATPQIEYSSVTVIQDTVNWIRISGIYLSGGGEKYLTIGNFYPDDQTDTLGNLGPNHWCYFYIDDVSVIDCGWSGIQFYSSELFNISPNPSNGNFQLSGVFPSQSEIHFYNLLGEEVEKTISIPEGNQTIPLELNLADGIYFYRIISGKEILHEEKIVIVK